ncbi:MAG: DUF6384 family protein [Alphaproteobacteria bacterium]|nr:DUF6384 family protein [Alphaproteobacteria bacterium]
MLTPTVPAVAQSPSTTEKPRKLDDVLLAMDVVDTLRHRERVADMELDAEAREEKLIGRLKEIYQAQGIEVPDRILKDGVKALDEQRFVYKPPENTLNVRLARLYVGRKAWLPQTVSVAAGLAALAAGWYVFGVAPQAAEWRRLPAEIAELAREGQALAVDPAVDQRIASIQSAGERALAERDRGEAKAQLAALERMNDQLADEYEVRIVSRPGEDTGFYRIPDDNPVGRNYYLVVEPVAPGGRVIEVPIVSEETQKSERVDKWAQRVEKAVFDKVAADKAPDQIIQNDILGYKARGVLEPTFDVPAPGGAITQW